MRNLKKILALVLALVMSMSLVTVASAAYVDEEQIDARYEEAVKVLSGMGIFQGYNGGESFGPKQPITREEVATMMYRVISTDITGKAGLYVEACDFADVNNGRWSEGYIGYCFNGNYVKGYEDGTFRPTANVTGYEVLAMILRAVGYDANGEFSGSNWKKNIGTTAQQLGILNNLGSDVVLSKPATREVVAELIFKTLAYVDMVEYTPAFSYQPIMGTSTTGLTEITLGEKNFALDRTDDYNVDDYGRPGYAWTYNSKYPYATVFSYAPVATYHVATTECQVAEDLSWSKTKAYDIIDMYVNGGAYEYTVQATDTGYNLGGQGTLLEVYDASYMNTEDTDRLVVVETWLARVEHVQSRTFDAAGHLDKTAKLYLDIYDGNTAAAYDAIFTDVNTYADQDVCLENAYADWTYKKGDYVLVNCHSVTASVVGGEVVYGIMNDEADIDVYGLASSVTGAQTYLWNTADKHTIDGKTYDDAEWFVKDDALDSPSKFLWLFDQYGNVIGNDAIATVYNYGFIENIQWQNPTMARGYAQATIRYIDGTSAVKTIYSVDGVALTYKTTGDTVGLNGVVSSSYTENYAAWCGQDMFSIVETPYGLVMNHVGANTVVDASGDFDTYYQDELTNAEIKTGNPAFVGDWTNVKTTYGDPDVVTTTTGTTTKRINSDTVFIFWSNVTKTFSFVTGYENVGHYTNATVDYLDTYSGNSYLEYVFVSGNYNAVNSNGVFYRTSATTGITFDAIGYNLYEVTGVKDGVLSTFTEYYDLRGTTRYVPYLLTYEDGYVDAAVPMVDGTTVSINGINYNVENYASGVSKYYDNGVLKLGSDYYNIVDVKPTYGEYASTMKYADIWVLYRTHTNGAKYAYQIYISYADNTGSAGTGSTVVTGIDVSVNNSKNLVVANLVNGYVAPTTAAVNYTYTLYMNGVAVAGHTAVAGTIAAGSPANSAASLAAALTVPGATYQVKVTVGTTIYSSDVFTV